MMKITYTTHSRHVAAALPWVLFLLFAPAYALAGGVVEELRPISQSLASATDSQNNTRDHRKAKCGDGVQEAPMSATATATNDFTPELISLVYDPVQKHTVLRWKAFVHEGQKAIQYHIYRWSLSHPARRLIAKVDGNTLEFVDTNQTVLGEVYFYDIVGIYHIDGKYQVWQYPSKRITPQQVETQDTPPQAGIGCSTLQGQQAPSGGWLWLLALPFLAFIRQRRHP